MERILGPRILLHPQIPKPLHMVNPRTILGQTWWDAARKIAYKRAGYKCECCGVHQRDAAYHKWLEAHEVYNIDYAKGRVEYLYLVALCHSCHNYIHQGRMQRLVEIGEFEKDKYWDILSHGRELLRAANLLSEIPNYDSTANVRWEDWRMVIGGVEYPPKFRSFHEWCRHFGYHERDAIIDESELEDYEVFMDEGGF